jgi:hypothetical protein
VNKSARLSCPKEPRPPTGANYPSTSAELCSSIENFPANSLQARRLQPGRQRSRACPCRSVAIRSRMPCLPLQLRRACSAQGVQAPPQPSSLLRCRPPLGPTPHSGSADKLEDARQRRDTAFGTTWPIASRLALKTIAEGTDPKVITEAYRKAHERLDNPPWLYIVHDLNPRAMSPKVKTFVSPQSWFVDLTLISVQ